MEDSRSYPPIALSLSAEQLEPFSLRADSEVGAARVMISHSTVSILKSLTLKQ